MTVFSTAEESKKLAGKHLRSVGNLIDQIDIDAIGRVFERLQVARDDGMTIYIAGNGGSAATAAHWANDLGKAAKKFGHKPIRVMCLSDNVPWITALGNDEGYDRIFSGQLENFAREGDVLIVISASGKSTILVRAVELARQLNLITIGFLGFGGGILKDMVDELIWIQTPEGVYEQVEDCHMILCHIMTLCLAQCGIEGQTEE